MSAPPGCAELTLIQKDPASCRRRYQCGKTLGCSQSCTRVGPASNHTFPATDTPEISRNWLASRWIRDRRLEQAATDRVRNERFALKRRWPGVEKPGNDLDSWLPSCHDAFFARIKSRVTSGLFQIIKALLLLQFAAVLVIPTSRIVHSRRMTESPRRSISASEIIDSKSAVCYVPAVDILTATKYSLMASPLPLLPVVAITSVRSDCLQSAEGSRNTDHCDEEVACQTPCLEVTSRREASNAIGSS